MRSASPLSPALSLSRALRPCQGVTDQRRPLALAHFLLKNSVDKEEPTEPLMLFSN